MSQPSKRQQHEVQLSVLWAEYLRSSDDQADFDRQAFFERHREFTNELQELAELADRVELMAGPTEQEVEQAKRATAGGAVVLEQTAEFDGSTKNGSQLGDLVTAGEGRDATDSLALGWRPGDAPTPFGEYELLQPIGRGGMGVVFKARQIAMNRTVALKMILSGRLASEADVERFRREAWSAGSLSHPNIVSIYEIGEFEGHHYFSMEYVEGRTLADVTRDGEVTPQRAARLLETVARAVGHAHEHGILHRDLKPANVLLDAVDEPHVTDFGLAKTSGDERMTSSGTALGTPAYMSPEQAAGLKGEIGPATDIYSLGAILYQLLTCQPPFQGESVVGVILDVLHREPPPPRLANPAVDRTLETICLKCLSKSPADRYASATELADDLRRFLDGRPVAAKPMGCLRRTGVWFGGVPIVAVLMGRRFVHSTSGQKRFQWGFFAAVLFSALLLAVLSTREKSLPRQIVIAGGSGGGIYDHLAEQLATSLQRETQTPVAVLETQGSLANQRLLASEDAHLALLQADALLAGELVVAAPLYYELVHVVIREQTQQQLSIESVSDLNATPRRLRVALGPLDSGSRETAERLLEKLGVEAGRLIDRRVAFEELLEDASLDVGVIITGPRSESLQRVLQSGSFRLLAMEDPGPIALSTPGLLPVKMQASDYAFVDPADFPSQGIATLAVPAFLAVRHDASPRLIRAALKVLYREGELVEKYGLVPPEGAIRWSALPWHPAASAFLEAELNGGAP